MAGTAEHPGQEHTAQFDTRTEAALFYDLIGGDGANFPDDFDDADQMAETPPRRALLAHHQCCCH